MTSPSNDRGRALRTVLPFAIAAAVVVVVSVAGWLAAARPWEPSPRPQTEHLAWLPVWMAEVPATPPVGAPGAVVDEAGLAAIARQVREIDPGADIRMIAHTRIAARDSLTLLDAVDGPLPESALAEGRAPGPGEVVLAADLAEELGLSVGDAVTLSDGAPHASLTLVGIGVRERRDNVSPRGYVAWGDAPGLIATWSPVQAEGQALTDAYVSWDGEVPPDLEPFLTAVP